MAVLEKVCIQSFTTPQQLELKHCLPHNYFYDVPIQSREVSRRIDIFNEYPVFQSVKLTANMTLPVLKPTEFNFCDLQNDPIQSILKEKEEYLNQLRAFAKVAKERKAENPKFMRNVDVSMDREVFMLNNNMVNLAECIDRDPHPYFCDSYVWLPVGGSIKHLNVGNKTYLITPDGNDFDKIRAVPIKQRGVWEESGPTNTEDCSPGGRIFQIVTSRHKKRGYVGVRQLNRFHVVRFKPSEVDDTLKSRKMIDVTDTAETFTGLDISSINGEMACTLDTSNAVKIYDIAAGKCIIDQKIERKGKKEKERNDDQVNAKFIQFSKQPWMMYITNKRKLYLKDMREPFKTSGTTFDVYDVGNGCEILSVTSESLVSEMLYCSSAHHSYTLDPRKGWVKRWNHGLDNMPVYLNVGMTEPFKEVVVTGSSEMGAVTGIVNTWNDSNEGIRPSFCSNPAAMPSIRDTAVWANSKGFWLEPSITKRVELSCCGMTLVPNESEPGCSLFTVNAIGDVFCVSLKPDENADSAAFLVHNTPEAREGGLQQIKKWEESHMKYITGSSVHLQCETLTDRYYMCNIMKQHLNSDATARRRVRDWKRAIAKGRGGYIPRANKDKDKPFSESKLRKLGSLKDWLASEILPFWNMDNLIQEARTSNPDKSIISIDSDDSS